MAGLINVRVNINHAALDGVIARLPAGQEAIADLAADTVVTKAKSIVPVRTGALQASIQKVGFGAERAVVADTNYAAFVEFGTRKMAAQPYLRPALESLNWPALLREFFRRIGL